MLNLKSGTKKLPKTMVIEMYVIASLLVATMVYQAHDVYRQLIAQTNFTIAQEEATTPAEEKMNAFIYEQSKTQEQKDYEIIKNSIENISSFKFIVKEMCTNKIVKNPSRANAVLDFMAHNNDYILKYMKAEDVTIIYKGVTQWRNGDYSSADTIYKILNTK